MGAEAPSPRRAAALELPLGSLASGLWIGRGPDAPSDGFDGAERTDDSPPGSAIWPSEASLSDVGSDGLRNGDLGNGSSLAAPDGADESQPQPSPIVSGRYRPRSDGL